MKHLRLLLTDELPVLAVYDDKLARATRNGRKRRPSDLRARMAGLENEAVKKYRPLIRRAGSGVMIFDCPSWDEPVLGAIPHDYR